MSDFEILRTTMMNAALGVEYTVHGNEHVESVIRDIDYTQPTNGIDPTNEYLAALADTCHGSLETPPGFPATTLIRAGSKHLFQSSIGSDCLDNLDGTYFSQVINWRSLIGSMSDTDRSRFGLGTDDPPPRNSSVWARLASLAPAQRATRSFVPEPKTCWMAKPVHWWTPRESTEPLLAKLVEGQAADDFRDKLGLYYSEYESEGTEKARAANLRFLVHVSIDALRQARHFRPGFIEAGGYCRFHVHDPRGTALDPWGRTVDLRHFHETGNLQEGLRERVSSRLDSVDFSVMPMQFDFLGELTCSRGESDDDSHAAFAARLGEEMDERSADCRSRFEKYMQMLPELE